MSKHTEDMAAAMQPIVDAYAAVAKQLRPTLRLRVGSLAFHFRDGFPAIGWTRVWWRLWRYRESVERMYLERHAALWGVEPIIDESVRSLRERVKYVASAPPGSKNWQRDGGDAA